MGSCLEAIKCTCSDIEGRPTSCVVHPMWLCDRLIGELGTRSVEQMYINDISSHLCPKDMNGCRGLSFSNWTGCLASKGDRHRS